jgi:hypothetical protein
MEFNNLINFLYLVKYKMGNLTSSQIGGIALFLAVIIAVVVLILTKKKDKSTPTMGPYPSIIPSQTPGVSQTPGASQTPGGGLINNSVFYDSNTGQILPNSSPCYTCYQQDNVCGCLMNNNCNPIPQVCQSSPCFQYETEYGGGNNVCNSDGIAAYTNSLNNNICEICNNVNPQNYYTNCNTLCEQGSFGLPYCSSCCNKVCGNGNICSSFDPKSCSNGHSIPKGTTAPCDACKQVCGMTGPMAKQECDDCNQRNGC